MPISRRGVLRSGGALAAAVLAGGCGRAAAARASDAGPAGLLEVCTGWTAGPDQNGLLALLADFKGRAPDVTFQAVPPRPAGDPPDSLQLRPGHELAEQAAAGRLERLDTVYAREGWAAVLPAGLLPLLRDRDGYLAVPVGVHRTNVLWSAPAGSAATAPGSVPEWLEALRRLERTASVPLALAGALGVRQLLETVLLAETGPLAWPALWRAGADWGAPGVTAALRGLRDVLALARVTGPDPAATRQADPGRVRSSAEADPADGASDASATAAGEAQAAAEAEAVRLLGTGQAGYLLAGDWVEPALRGTYGLRAGSGYRWAAAPGTAGVFQFRADVFALPRGARNRAAALAWLAECGSVDGQVALNGARGAIPARTDVPAPARALFGPYLRWSMDDWRAGPALDSLAHGEPVEPAWASGIDRALAQFRTDGDVPRLQDGLAALAARHAAGDPG